MEGGAIEDNYIDMMDVDSEDNIAIPGVDCGALVQGLCWQDVWWWVVVCWDGKGRGRGLLVVTKK